MKIHSNQFKEEIKKIGKQIDSKITFGETVLGSSELNAVTPSFQGGILKSVMKQLDIDSNVEIPVGTEVNYKFGLLVDGEYEYLDFGNYIVKEVEKQEDTLSYKITCYDKLLYSMKEYQDMNLTFPITIRDYINSVCEFLGLTFANKDDEFCNYDKLIENELYLSKDKTSLDYTFRDVFDELAQATASTICINDNDEVEIRYINETNETIDEEFLKDINVTFGQKFGAVNTIVLTRAGESDSIYYPSPVPENPIEIKISENQIMNFNDRSDYLPGIYEKLNGLEYYINDFVSTGLVYFDLCDKFNVKIGNNIYNCIMFNDEILVTQGLQENVFTEMPEETKTDYSKSDKTDRKVNQAYLIVNKQEGTIEGLVSSVKEITEQMGDTYTKEEVNKLIVDAETGLTNTFSISGGSNLLRNTAPYFMTGEDEAEYWDGKVKQTSEPDAISGFALLIQNGLLSQSVAITNDIYSVSFKYKTLNNGASCKVRYNGKEFDLTEEEGEIHTSGQITSGQLTFEVECNSNNAFELYDLMLKRGDEGANNVLVWTQNSNETISDTVQISKGITAFSNATDTKATMDSEGFKVRNKTTDVIVMEATKSGGKFLDLTSTGKANISGLIIEKHDRQVWGTGG